MQYRPLHTRTRHSKYPSTTPRLTPNIRAPHRDSHQISEHHTETHITDRSRVSTAAATHPPSAIPQCRGAKKAPAHAVDPSQSETKTSLPSETQYRKPDSASSWRSRQRPKHAHAAMPERPNASTQPQCPSGSRTGTAAMPERPKTPRRPCNHHTAMPERSMASGPRHQDTQATITPQCPSGPWTSTAAMPERLRDNHHTAMPERSMDKRSRNARAAQGQPSHRNARAVHGQAQPQCPSGTGTTTHPPHRNATDKHSRNARAA